MIPGAPPPGTLHKQRRASNAWERRLEWARQPTGGWQVGDFCQTPSGRVCRVVVVDERRLSLRYCRGANDRRAYAPRIDVELGMHLCRWMSPREVQALRSPVQGGDREAV